MCSGVGTRDCSGPDRLSRYMDIYTYLVFSSPFAVRPRPTGLPIVRPTDRPTDIPSSNHDMISESDFPRPVHLPRRNTLFASLSPARHALAPSPSLSSLAAVALFSLRFVYMLYYYHHYTLYYCTHSSRFPRSAYTHIYNTQYIPAYFVYIIYIGK